MSLASALSVALSGLQASTTALQLVSGNISNAGTSGFTEKQIVLEPVTLGTDVGGVNVEGYKRVTDSVLTTSLNSATGTASYLGTQYKYMQQVQNILNSTADNPALSSAISNFQSAWQQFSEAPEDSTQQQNVITAGQTLANTINNISGQVASLQDQVNTDVSTTVTTLNSNLQQVVTLNGEIATATASNQPTVDLEDQRDQVVTAIAAITNVQVMSRPEGQIALYTTGGTALVDGNAQTFTYNGGTGQLLNSSGQDASSALTGGSLQAEIQFVYNGSPAAASTAPGVEMIRKLQSQLSGLCSMFTTTTGSPQTFASAYDDATTTSGGTAVPFFTVSSSGGVDDPSTFAVNSNIVNGTTTIAQADDNTSANAFLAVANSFTATRSFTADGLSTTNTTYSQIGSAVLSGFQSAANSLQTSSTTATAQQNYFQTTLTSETGVNVDSELVNLTNLQNSYAASAHVISTIQNMLTTLETAMSATG